VGTSPGRRAVDGRHPLVAPTPALARSRHARAATESRDTTGVADLVNDWVETTPGPEAVQRPRRQRPLVPRLASRALSASGGKAAEISSLSTSTPGRRRGGRHAARCWPRIHGETRGVSTHIVNLQGEKTYADRT
jgi:hypothetical protein